MALTDCVYLIDKSALARLRHPSVAAVLAPIMASGQVASCGVLALEVLYSARNQEDFLRTRRRLAGLPSLPALEDDFTRAIDVLERLSQKGQHRSARLPDLLLAAVAERHDVTVLHYDADYDLIGAVTGQPTRWVVARGSVP